MRLDPVLLEILVCPDCNGSLSVDTEHEELVCNGCGLVYPVRDDIPVMLVEEARRPDPPAHDPLPGDRPPLDPEAPGSQPPGSDASQP